jgi:hypothetical protein
MSAGKKILGGFISTLAWLVLAIALLVTSANLIVGSLNHVGESAAGIVKQVSADPATLNSLVDELAKGAEPQLAREIAKNRTQINQTITSLTSSQEFRDLIASTLDQISQAALHGSSSVTVDFSKIANFVAAKVNAAAKETLIKQKDLESLKPTVIDLSKQSKNIVNAKSKLRLALLIWVLWVLLLAVNFLLRGSVVLRTAGIQLISVGVIGLLIRFVAPAVLESILNKPDVAVYQRRVIPEVFTLLTNPILTFSIILLSVGVVATGLSIALSKKSKEPLA